MNSRLLLALLTSQIALTATSGSAIADENATLLDTIVVTATRSETKNLNFPGKITVIGSEQIEKSGATSLVDVLRSTGGVQISDLFGDGTNATIGLRGFSETAGQNTLILIDGRRLNNADLAAPDLNTISLKDIERIEIIKGSASVLYGDKAVGGVINIITRAPDSFRVNTELGFGSFNKKTYFASAENLHTNGFGYRINAKHRESNNFRDNNETELTDFYGKGIYKHNTGTAFFEYQDIDENLGLPGPLSNAEIANNREQTVNPSDFSNTSSKIGRIGFIQSLSSNLKGQVEYTNRRSNSSGISTVARATSPVTTERKHAELTPRLTFTQDSTVGDRIFTLGADFFETDYRLESTFGVTDNVQKQRSIYFHGVVPVSDTLTISAGARHARVKNDLIASFGSTPNEAEIDDNENAWELGVSNEVNNNWRVFAKADRNFRFAVADELSGVLGFLPFPETQTGRSYEAGAEWQNGQTKLGLEIYQLDLNNEISFDPARFVNTNIGDSKRRGVILEGSHNITPSWTINANISYLNHEITSGTLKGSNIPLVADRTAAISTSYQYSQKLSGYIEVIATSDRVLGGDFNNTAGRVAGYAVSNLNLSYKVNNFRLGLRVNNLFDKEYNDNGNFSAFSTPPESFFPAPERNYFFTIQYNYN